MVSTELLNSLRRTKRSGYNFAKRMSEIAWMGRAWMDGAADLGVVRQTIAKLRPLAMDKPLIRVGSSGDGGYLLPDDLDGLTGCVSPGVAGEVGFDLQLAERGVKVVMADASVSGVPVAHDNFHFHKKFLATHNDGYNIRLQDLVEQELPDGDLILQMDIEGAEFAVLLDTPDELLRRFRIIVLEVHDFGQIFGRFSSRMMQAFVDKLTRSHGVVHIHPNNCCGSDRRRGIDIPRVLEFTFYRRDRGVSDSLASRTYPHPLDEDNVPGKAPLVLPDIWFKG